MSVTKILTTEGAITMLRAFCVATGLLCFLLLGMVPARGELLLELSVPKQQYVVNEPLFAVVSIRNSGGSERTILRHLRPGAGLLSLEIAAPGENAHRFRPLFEFSYARAELAGGAIVLAPGETYSAALDLTFDGGISKSVLSKAGEYAISAKYQIPDGLGCEPVDLASKDIQIYVSEPVGADRGAYDILRDGAQGLQRGFWNGYTAQAQYYQRLLSDYPESRYAVHAKFYLAQVYELDAAVRLHGSTEGRGALERAAVLFASVAGEVADTPHGVCAKMYSARCYAKLGNSARAQHLLEESFSMPAATDEDRLLILSWIRHVQTGYFYKSSGLASKGTGTPSWAAQRDIGLPLRQFADALGFSVGWNRVTKAVSVSGPRVAGSFVPGDSTVTINGLKQAGIATCVRGGRTYVSPWVIGKLMSEHYGGMNNEQ